MQTCSWRSPLRPSRNPVRRHLRAVCFCSAEDLYSILSVPSTASQAEIKAAYRRLVHDLHPDKHAHKLGQSGTAEAFLRCKLAYEVLSDSEQRQQYDQALAAAPDASSDVQQGGSPAGSWSPYNAWMDAYGAPSTVQSDSSSGSDGPAGEQHTDDYYQTLQAAATATAAAGACSSGLSDYRDPLLAAAAAAAGSDSAAAAGDPQGAGQHQQQTPAVLRAALLDEHGIALEQFGSLQDAVAALAKRDQQQTLVGLAEGDYDTAW